MTTAASFIRPIDRDQRLYERVADQLLALIRQGELKAGDRLPTERELSDAFQVSRTVIREAVKYLEAQGLLRVTSGSGIYVQNPDSDLVSRTLSTYLELAGSDDYPIHLIEVRRVLEVEMVGLAAMRATTKQKVRLREICHEMRANVLTERHAELDFQLHTLLAEATQNELFPMLLQPLIDQVFDLMRRTWAGYGKRPVERVFREHEAIVAALEAGDAAAARRAMADHLTHSEAVMAEIARRRME